MLTTLEARTGKVNALLKEVLPMVQAADFSHPELRKAVEAAERLSRWKRYQVPSDWLAHAVMRADSLAKENGEPYVVLYDGGPDAAVVMPKSRFKTEPPFGFIKDDIRYDTDGPADLPPPAVQNEGGRA